MKNEIKIEYGDSNKLIDFIVKSYSENTIKRGDISLIIEDHEEHLLFLKDIPNATIKLYNQDILDGYMRFIVNFDDQLKLYPISIFYIEDNKKYFFY